MNEQHAPPESPPSDSGATHRNRLWRVGVVADTIAAAAGLYSFLNSDILLTVLTIVAFLFVASSWFWRRRTGPAVALLVVGCLILGAGGTMKIRDLINSGSTPAVLPAPTPPTTRPSTSSAPPQTQTTDPGGATGAPDTDQPRKLVDQTITLPRHAAVDVDRSPPVVKPDNENGATGDYDLYHEGGGNQYDSVQAVNAPNVYYYPAVTAPAKLYFSCQDTFAWPPFPSLGVGGSFCFRSSKQHTGYVSILRRDADNAVILHVTTWEDR